MTLSTLNDQAAGLRQLFAAPHQTPSVHALTCLNRPACVLPLVQALLHGRRQNSDKHAAWLDELDLQRREDWPLPCSVRFDLGQSLQDRLPLSASLQPLQAGVWYALARRLQQVPAVHLSSIDQRLQRSGLPFDQVLISADPTLARDWRIYAPRIHHTLLCSPDSVSLNQTLEWMARIPQQQVASWHLVLTGDAARAAVAAEQVHRTTPSVLGSPVKISGPLGIDVQSGALLDFSRHSSDLVAMLGVQLASS